MELKSVLNIKKLICRMLHLTNVKYIYVKEDLLIGSIKMKFLLYFQRVYIEIFLNLNHYRGCSL